MQEETVLDRQARILSYLLTENQIAAIESNTPPTDKFEEFLPLVHAELYLYNVLEEDELQEALVKTPEHLSLSISKYCQENADEVRVYEESFVQDLQEDKKAIEMREKAETILLRNGLKSYHLPPKTERAFIEKLIRVGCWQPYIGESEEPEADYVEFHMRAIESLYLYGALIADTKQIEKFLTVDDEIAEARYLDFCRENRDALKVQTARLMESIEQRTK